MIIWILSLTMRHFLALVVTPDGYDLMFLCFLPYRISKDRSWLLSVTVDTVVPVNLSLCNIEIKFITMLTIIEFFDSAQRYRGR